jgi:hypothetical protein
VSDETWEDKTDHWTIDPPEEKMEELKESLAGDSELTAPRLEFDEDITTGLIVYHREDKLLVTWSEEKEDWVVNDFSMPDPFSKTAPIDLAPEHESDNGDIELILPNSF